MTVVAGQVLPVEVALRETVVVREELTVSATPIQEGQARALNQQRTAPNIVNVISADQIGQFPDSNAAEATQRIPGVTIERDQGEGRYVAIRGTEPRLNSMMINGERIPSPEGDIRAVALDVVPTDLLEAIEVTKALTPDMDADAIGGAVNLITKGAPARPVVFGTVAGGYNSLMDDWGQGTFTGTAGRRFAGGKLGADPHRQRQRRQPRFGQLRGRVRRWRPRRIRDARLHHQPRAVRRERRARLPVRARKLVEPARHLQSLLGSGVPPPHGARHRRQRARVGIERSARDAGHQLALDGRPPSAEERHAARLFGVRSPTRRRTSPAPTTPSSSRRTSNSTRTSRPASIDPDNIQPNPLNTDVNEALFDEQSIEDNITTDRDVVAGVNLRMPLAASPTFAGSVKFGGKYRTEGEESRREHDGLRDRRRHLHEQPARPGLRLRRTSTRDATRSARSSRPTRRGR